jgi:hypothetical protein
MESPARFRVVCCGRRWGKTLGFAHELLRAALLKPGDYGWIGPTYPVTERGVDALQRIAPDLIFRGTSPRMALLPNRSRIVFLSAEGDDATRILGWGFRGIVIDEAPRVAQKTLDQAIRPTLTDHQGWAAYVGTPKGRNWFFDQYTRGRAGQEGFASFQMPTASNPLIARKELEEARASLPEDVFRQEYLAEFLEDSAGVFRGIDACLMPAGMPRGPAEGPYVLGVDLAKHQDFTVLIAADMRTGRCVEMQRFNRIDWPFQRDRIVELARALRARIVLDATGVGDAVYDELVRVWPAVEPVKLTSASKTEIIQGLMLAIERAELRWPAEWDVLTDELRRYEYDYSPQGRVSYNAPAGYHDDCVIALALAQWGRRQPRSGFL